MRIGQAAVDWQERIDPARMRQERLAKLQPVMKRHGLPCLLLNRLDNFRYATGIRGLPYPQINYALVFAEHEPVIYLLGDSIEQNKVNCPWIKPENRRLAYTWWGGMAGPAAAGNDRKRRLR